MRKYFALLCLNGAGDFLGAWHDDTGTRLMHPYKQLPDTNFWRRAIVDVAHLDLDPVTAECFRIGRNDPIATAGSCFAQHMSRTLAADGYDFLVTEHPGEAEIRAGASAAYSARYGNIYTSRQLLQLFQRAYGLSEPRQDGWLRSDGQWVDPFRPNEFPHGFDTLRDLERSRTAHYAAVRRMFEECATFVFTLGLTETWLCEQDGMAVPLAPGVVADPPEGLTYRFENLDVGNVGADLDQFVRLLTRVNPPVRIILTVSPVPLEATYERRHVLVSTAYSKAVLRVAAEQIASAHPEKVSYFPSYEMVTAFPRADSFEDDLRTVRPAVVAHVMEVFKRHYQSGPTAHEPIRPQAPLRVRAASQAGLEHFGGILCDEELLGRL